MRRTLVISLGFLFILFIAFFLAKKKDRPTFFEDFKNSTLDTTVWSRIPRGTADWNNYMTTTFDSCYDIKDGNLILRGMINYTEKNDTAPYLTGGVYTKGKVNFECGRLEVRAKLKGAQGCWPAIWLLPAEAKWPKGGEIDLMERLNHDSIAYQTVHSYYTLKLGGANNPPHYGTNKINVNDYNVYAVTITKDSMRFEINGKHTFTYPKIETDKEGQYPFGKPFYLLLDMQLGGSWVGKINPKELPTEMYIDWVKFYKEE